MTKNEIRKLAEELEKTYNPYIKKAIRYMVGNEERFLAFGEMMTRQDIADAYIETAMKDIKFGFCDRMVGYYDKWYRYSRADEGRAYDKGVRIATTNKKCKAEMNIIEVNPLYI